jgi:hypothetical protein
VDAQVTAALISGAAVILAAGVGLLAARRSRPTAEADKRSKVPVTERLKFVDVAVDVSTHDWHEGQRGRTPATHDARWYITRYTFNEGADLPIVATLLNTGDVPIVVSRIGVEVVAAYNSWGTGRYYGDAPRARPIESIGQYELRLAASDEVARGIDRVMAQDPDSDDWLDIGALRSVVLRKPIYVEPAAPFTYTTNLKRYDEDMSTDAVLRLWIQTDSGEVRSDDILVTFGR